MQRFGGLLVPALIPAFLGLVVFVLPRPVSAQHEHRSPYAGHEQMEISSLSPDQLQELRTGEGMGLARAAELNHYPGPKHALELATELRLSPEQLDRLTAIRRTMSEEAIAKGAEIIAAERVLTELFRKDKPDDVAVRSQTAVLGALYGELRAIHLIAHLGTAEVMTDQQIDAYDGLRGYEP